MNTDKIYPEVHIVSQGDTFILKSMLRKKIGRHYWLKPAVSMFTGQNISKLDCLQTFHQDMYYELLRWKKVSDIRDVFGDPIFIKDSDQRSPEEKLLSKFSFAKK